MFTDKIIIQFILISSPSFVPLAFGSVILEKENRTVGNDYILGVAMFIRYPLDPITGPD